MMPQTRERIGRAAKDKAVENLHELNASYHKTNTTPASLANKTKQRVNRSSYKPFAVDNAANQLSDDEQQHSDNNGDTYETSSKKVTRTRRNNKETKQQQQGVSTARSKLNFKQTETTSNDIIFDPGSTDSSLFSHI